PAYQKLVVGIAIGQRPDARLGASVRDVLRRQEAPEARIGRQHLCRDRLQYLLANLRLLRLRDRGRELLSGSAKGESSGFCCASVFTWTSAFSSRYFGGTRLSSMPVIMSSVICAKAVGILPSRVT